jgi:N-acetylglutamate synthase-like GNAT family acetyltransferase
MPALLIRPATQADQPTIRRMIRAAGINPMSLKWPNFLVAEEGGMTIGIGQVKRHGDGSLELASLAVVPDRQGQGIGSALVRELIAHHEDTVLHLTCRSQLQAYYERFGFRRLQRAEFPPYFARFIPMFNAIGRLYRMQIVVMRREPDRNPSTQNPLEPS